MACFDRVISLIGLCETPETFSGIYLNDIGVTRQFIDDVITDDYRDEKDFLEKKIASSMRIIKSRIHAYHGSLIKSGSLVAQHRVGYTAENTPISTGADHRGIQITLNNYSNYINLELSQLSLHVDVNGTVPILVYDLLQNKLIDSFNVTAVANQIVTVFPHKAYSSELGPLNLFIGYDATGINTVTTSINKNSGGCCGGSTTCATQYLTAKGVSNDQPEFIDQNMAALTHTSGISLVYSLSCDPYSWMCGYAQVLAPAIAYKVASEIYRHGIITKKQRSSNSQNLDAETMKEVQLFYEGEYDVQMKSILSAMRIPSDSVCFQCTAPVRHDIILP